MKVKPTKHSRLREQAAPDANRRAIESEANRQRRVREQAAPDAYGRAIESEAEGQTRLVEQAARDTIDVRTKVKLRDRSALLSKQRVSHEVAPRNVQQTENDALARE